MLKYLHPSFYLRQHRHQLIRMTSTTNANPPIAMPIMAPVLRVFALSSEGKELDDAPTRSELPLAAALSFRSVVKAPEVTEVVSSLRNWFALYTEIVEPVYVAVAVAAEPACSRRADSEAGSDLRRRREPVTSRLRMSAGTTPDMVPAMVCVSTTAFSGLALNVVASIPRRVCEV